eukprot:4711535-Pleurochrysis_carterae.AAC.1
MSLLLIGAGGASALAAAGLTRTAAPVQAARAAVSMVELSSPDFTLAILGDLHVRQYAVPCNRWSMTWLVTLVPRLLRHMC